jgi:hypothetical protein
VARTAAATRNYSRQPTGKPDRLADTQIQVNYRGTDWVRDDAEGLAATIPAAGDRAPDAAGLARLGIGFPFAYSTFARHPAHLSHPPSEYPDGDDGLGKLG